MKAIVLSAGFEPRTARLQPHRTLLEMGKQLARLGHEAVLVSDCIAGLPEEDEMAGLTLRRVPSVHLFRGRDNPALLAVLEREAPDVILWHLDLNSFIHQEFKHRFSHITYGVVTSPVYANSLDILRLGAKKLASNPDLAATHFSGSLVPALMVRRAFAPGGLRGLITLSETTRQHLLRRGAPAGRVWVAPPGVDAAWLDTCLNDEDRTDLRCQLHFDDRDFVVTYFGSPAPVRGLFTMLEGLEKALEKQPNLGLVVLSRRRTDEWEQQTNLLDRAIARPGLRGRVRLVDGFLQQEDLIRYLLASDAVCLPFELVPSDVPLSILEAMALRKAVIGTTVACIPELLADGRGFLAPPASPTALADLFEMLATSPELIEARGQAARAYVASQRMWTHMGKLLERVVTSVDGNV
jgi:glycosyltransferase involved in cell wall biosynthesis